ncbi:MAG: Crp/Fnr family transcriptional regulator [Pseudomonadales bacterium]|nr:Crp/Fnr family transcriptional regulator [Pseudomonadales bacterium]
MNSALTTANIRDILTRGNWFSGLNDHLQQQLFKLGKQIKLQSGERLFSRGDQPCGLYAVLSGNIRITGTGINGKEAILTLVEAPQWFGEIALFDNQARTHDAMAESSCLLWNIPQNKLTDLLYQHPEYWQDFGKLLTHKLRLAFQLIEDVALLPALPRLARRLLIMGEESGPGNMCLSIPQEVLGSMLGISRQTTNQILKELEQKGIIRLARSQIEILDPARLQQIAGNMLSA